jgi:hypothetical protein
MPIAPAQRGTKQLGIRGSDGYHGASPVATAPTARRGIAMPRITPSRQPHECTARLAASEDGAGRGHGRRCRKVRRASCRLSYIRRFEAFLGLSVHIYWQVFGGIRTGRAMAVTCPFDEPGRLSTGTWTGSPSTQPKPLGFGSISRRRSARLSDDRRASRASSKIWLRNNGRIAGANRHGR